MSDAKQEEPGLFSDPAESDDVLIDDDQTEDIIEDIVEDTVENQPVSQSFCFETEDFSRDCISAGSFLREYRKKLGITLEFVEAETKIKITHLQAIENGNFEELPQPVHPVYIVACVKKLGNLYKLDEETLNGISAGLKNQILCQAPDDVSKSCYGHEINEESLRKQRRLLLLLAMAAGVILLVIAAGIVILFSVFFRKTDPALQTPFTQESLLRIQPEPKLKITPLPAVED